MRQYRCDLYLDKQIEKCVRTYTFSETKWSVLYEQNKTSYYPLPCFDARAG